MSDCAILRSGFFNSIKCFPTPPSSSAGAAMMPHQDRQPYPSPDLSTFLRLPHTGDHTMLPVGSAWKRSPRAARAASLVASGTTWVTTIPTGMAASTAL